MQFLLFLFKEVVFIALMFKKPQLFTASYSAAHKQGALFSVTGCKDLRKELFGRDEALPLDLARNVWSVHHGM